MSAASSRIRITRRSALVGLVVVVVVVAWLFAFYFPQTRKLAALGSQRTALQSTVAADEARLAQLQNEAQHVTQIKAMYDRLHGYAPRTGQLYTYIRTISGAAKSAGVTITSLQPSPIEAVSGTTYSAIPITAAIKGPYDRLLAFVKDLYDLPRLTDVNALSVTGGGPGTSRSTILTVSLQLAIFTSEKPAGATS
ncbi:MAG: type 4a pilus biogenesis protein PilO [Actinomycetota bacterium]|jgi:Tfp pilus assembly protein PilO|nr:type 4a pilus biogenesis protein PilO [Actinomycetota bacterium]